MRSVDRILTTHVGSLPRPPALLQKIVDKETGRGTAADFAQSVRQAVDDIVAKQASVGLDIVNDGEMGRYGFISYINERLDGFRFGYLEDGSTYWGKSREGLAFPEYYNWSAKQQASAAAVNIAKWVCCGTVSYKGQAALDADIRNLQDAVSRHSVKGGFACAISTTNVETWQRNEFYPSERDYRYAIADAMRHEYRSIADAGLSVQIDDPALASYYLYNPNATLPEFRKWAEERIEVLNHALEGIPQERIRYHTCYGINIGPRTTDLELKHFGDLLLKIRAGVYSFEASNPRHEHEWRVWKELKIPDDKVLMPGVVTQSSVLVEHPELVADRIQRFAEIVGRERVIASTDCGFASFATSNEIHESIVWEKLRALVEGARIASERLWK
ncbi:MAG: epoxyalkane--coenzyme M transferase [Pseudolabrys sp.]